MKVQFLIFLMFLMMLAAAACTAPSSLPGTGTSAPAGTGVNKPGQGGVIELTPVAPEDTIVVPVVPSLEPQITPGGAMVPAVERVINSYASQYSLNLADIKLVSSEQVDWPDGCLGVVTPGVMCIEVITPGYRIILDVKGETVELHSNLSGDYFLVAPPGNLEVLPHQ